MKKSTQDTIWTLSTILITTLVFIFFQTKEFRKQETTLEPPSIDYWKKFAKIGKERKYIEEASAYYRIPVFTPELLALSGQEITLSGYYLPYSMLDSVIILSRFPNSSCFYCGMAGIESVAMVELTKESPQYRTDQRLIVQGKLFLNDSNVGKLAFVIADASVEEL